MQTILSIIVPCYNQAIFIDECLESVFNQDFTEWECIIVNDGSPDNTDEIVKKWLETDKRFKYEKQKNRGVAAARNTGMALAKGKYILPLDADDRIGMSYGKLAVKELEKNHNTKLVYCEAEKFGDESGVWKLPDFSLLTLSKTNPIFCSAVFKKSDWEEIGGYDENMEAGLEDWEFWIALLKNGGEVVRLPYVGFFYRKKSSSRQRDIDKDDFVRLNEYIIKKHSDFYYKIFQEINTINRGLELKLQSEKYMINRFFQRFFGFKIFKIG